MGTRMSGQARANPMVIPRRNDAEHERRATHGRRRGSVRAPLGSFRNRPPKHRHEVGCRGNGGGPRRRIRRTARSGSLPPVAAAPRGWETLRRVAAAALTRAKAPLAHPLPSSLQVAQGWLLNAPVVDRHIRRAKANNFADRAARWRTHRARLSGSVSWPARRPRA